MTWSTSGYLGKASKYWNKATSVERDDPSFLLFASFFLEYLVRAALCSKNPALNAELDEDSILYASGVDVSKSAKTIGLAAALKRLKRIYPEISSEDLNAIDILVQARNSEFHSDEASWGKVETNFVIPHLYSITVSLVDFVDISLSALLGANDATQARKTADARRSDRKKRVQSAIQVQHDRFYHLDKDEQNERRKSHSGPSGIRTVLASGHHVAPRQCPSCKSTGYLGGTPVGRTDPFLSDGQIIREVRVIPELFECKVCDLKIQGLDELIAAGMPPEMLSIEIEDVLEHFNINPLEHVDLDEIRREMDYERFEGYMDE